MKKNRYTQEFKESAVNLCIESEKSISTIAKDLGLNKGTLSLWVSDYKKLHNIKSKKDIKTESLDDELKRVKKELSIARQERDILKKATAYFAKEAM